MEGAWNGPYEEGDFLHATVFLGTGARITESGVHFGTPTHTLQRLHLVKSRDRVFVSNSLPFLLVRTGDEPDPDFPFYEADLSSIRRGLRGCVGSIPAANGKRVRLFYHCTVSVGWDLRIRTRSKREPAGFTSFEDYTSFLRSTIGAICGNAADPRREVQYEPLTTISSGYDSPAVATLLKQVVGQVQSVTFRTARRRPGMRVGEDSGRNLANRLGIPVEEYDRLDYLSREDVPEAEFMAVGTEAEDVVMCAFEERLPGTLLFGGTYAGAMWARPVPWRSRNILKGDPSGASIEEFRLRVGFIHAPVPGFALTRQPTMARINQSREMDPWSVGGHYDRPIPRRILEEHGIPRGAFAREKRAVSQPIKGSLQEVMTPAGYRDFQIFSEGKQALRGSGRRAGFAFMRVMYELNLRLCWRFNRLAERRGWYRRLRPWVSDRYARPLSRNVFAFQWAVSRVMPRYRVDAGASGTDGGTSVIFSPKPETP